MTSGATVWKKLTASNLDLDANPFGSNLVHARHLETSGNAGGALTTGTWTERSLNTLTTNEITGASLSSNLLTLPAGTYFVDGVMTVAASPSDSASPFVDVPRLRNLTTNATLVIGTPGRQGLTVSGSTVTVPFQTTRSMRGRFTLAGISVLQLQHYWSGSATGVVIGRPASSGESEIYSDLLIWKLT